VAKTPTSYDPQFWSSAVYRSLDLYSGQPIDDSQTVAQLLVEYFRHSPEQPTHYSYKVVNARQRKFKTSAIEKILEKMESVDGRLESMYIESIRDDDHTHAVASLGYTYDNIGRENSKIGVHCFEEDFDISVARDLAEKTSRAVQLDYGFSSCQCGIVNAISFGRSLRIDSDAFSANRERWLREFQLREPRPCEVPFLDVFEINVLSDMHLSKVVSGRSFESYVRDKGRGILERIGKANFLWCLEPDDAARAKVELAECALVAMV
jgi:hypothetical protein